MTLHQLEVFGTVAKLRSFTQAGEKLHIAQPAVSGLIRSLEQELGVKLFERLGNRYHLTNAGEELLHHAEEMLAKVEAIKERMDEIKGLKKGKISVGGSTLAVASVLPVVVQRFKKEHVGVEVILTTQRSETLHQKLLDGELDVAILGRAPHSPNLVGEPFRDEEVVVIAPPKHPLAMKRSVSLELLAKEPLIVYRGGTTIRGIVERRFAEKGLPFAPFLEINLQWGNRDAIKNVVVNGLGIGFTSKFYVGSDVKAGRLKVLRVPELKLKRTMYIAVHRNRQSSPLVRTFIDFLRHYKEQ